MERIRIKFIFIFSLAILMLPFFVLADSQGQNQNFSVDPTYSLQKQEQVQAVLQKVSATGYFYLESAWYQSLSAEDKKTVDQNLESLSQEFENKIYPKLTLAYGKEWSPGIDNDYHITILFHKMKEDARGYFNSGDEYPKIQNPKSNEREMIYLSAEALLTPNVKSYLAHEFTHLITSNQKDRLRGVSEDVWLNEARAEYAPTLLGYDDDYAQSNLQQRVKIFINAPNDSLTDWLNQTNDYGVINIFTQYLVDQYGVAILTDSMKSQKAGISSINEALLKEGFSADQDFAKIFTDWTVAIYLNDCALGQRYCYKNPNLKNLRIAPSLIFFPSTQKTKFLLDYSISQWSGNWYRIIGGEGKLDVTFSGDSRADFKVPYVLCKDTQCWVDFLTLDSLQNGTSSFEKFGTDWTSLTLIPSVQTKISDGTGLSFSFSITAEMTNTDEEQKQIQDLRAKISELRNQIAQVLAQLNAILGKKQSCLKFEDDLYFGLTNNQEVSCLQEFLKSRGTAIYPEGLVTGNFFDSTKAAVIKYQAAKGIIQTGYFGPKTRAAANAEL